MNSLLKFGSEFRNCIGESTQPKLGLETDLTTHLYYFTHCIDRAPTLSGFLESISQAYAQGQSEGGS